MVRVRVRLWILLYMAAQMQGWQALGKRLCTLRMQSCSVCSSCLYIYLLAFVMSGAFNYRAMLCRVRLCHSMSSVCPAVTFRYRDHIGWKTSKIISRPNSLRPLLGLRPNMGHLVQREHPQNQGGMGVGHSGEHSQGPSEQKPIKYFGRKVVWAYPGTALVLSTLYYPRNGYLVKLRTSNFIHTFIGSVGTKAR